MLFSIIRKAGIGAALSLALAFSVCTVAMATPEDTGSLFNSYNLSNRDKEATDAVIEASQKCMENVRVGLTANVATSIGLAVDEGVDVSYVEQPESDNVPDSVLRAMSCLGIPYCSGSSSPSGFDCSGLVSYALTGNYGHAYRSYDFWDMPEVEDPRPGDVVACSAGHCGLYIGDGQMIHAPESGAVVRIEAIRGKVVRPAV